jgi:hypothetical protein
VSRLRSIAEGAGYQVKAHTEFESVRRLLNGAGELPNALVSNVRLGEFNGIHLVYLAKLHDSRLRALVYGRPHDPMLAREAQRASAFYQRQGFLSFSLASFLRAGLPVNDRRDVSGIDRRTTFRGGRRTTDVASLHFALGAI